jgi:hypothetical protein
VIAKYSKKFPYAPYLNEDIGYDISIPDNASDEEMIEAIVRLNRVATAAYYRLNPHIKPAAHIPQGEQVRQVDKGSVSDVVMEIKACKDLKTLKTYCRIAQLKPEYMDAYNEQALRITELPKKKNGKPVLP